MTSRKTKEFSIIIMTYNRKRYLEKCLDSVFAQDYPKSKYEIIVVDDGSTDGTEKFVKNLLGKHKNIRYIKHEKNRGVAAARNTGIKNSKGEFVCMLADDYVLPRDYLEFVRGCFKNKNVHVVRFRVESIERDLLSCTLQGIFDFNMASILYGQEVKKKGVEERYFNESRKSFNLPASGAAGFRKERIKGMDFNDRFHFGEDSHFSILLEEKNISIYFFPGVVIFRHNPLSLSESLAKFFCTGFYSSFFEKKSFFSALFFILPRSFLNSILAYKFIPRKNPLCFLLSFILFFPRDLGFLSGFLLNKSHKLRKLLLGEKS